MARITLAIALGLAAAHAQNLLELDEKDARSGADLDATGPNRATAAARGRVDVVEGLC